MPLPQSMSVFDVSAGAPIIVTTTIPHGIATGDTVVLKGVRGNTAANGVWRVTVLTDATFSLNGSSANHEYAGGGTVYPTAGGPRPPGPNNADNEPLWTPWYSTPASVAPHEFFLSSTAATGTNEISTSPKSPGDGILTEEIDGSLFTPGEHLTLSIYCRMPEPAEGVQSLKMIVTAVLGSVRTYAVSFSASQITGEYQRFSMSFVLDPAAVTRGGVVRIEFLNEVVSGKARPMYWTRPMLNDGDVTAPWTPEVGPLPRGHDFYPPISS